MKSQVRQPLFFGGRKTKPLLSVVLNVPVLHEMERSHAALPGALTLPSQSLFCSPPFKPTPSSSMPISLGNKCRALQRNNQHFIFKSHCNDVMFLPFWFAEIKWLCVQPASKALENKCARILTIIPLPCFHNMAFTFYLLLPFVVGIFSLL